MLFEIVYFESPNKKKTKRDFVEIHELESQLQELYRYNDDILYHVTSQEIMIGESDGLKVMSIIESYKTYNKLLSNMIKGS